MTWPTCCDEVIMSRDGGRHGAWIHLVESLKSYCADGGKVDRPMDLMRRHLLRHYLPPARYVT